MENKNNKSNTIIIVLTPLIYSAVARHKTRDGVLTGLRYKCKGNELKRLKRLVLRHMFS